MCDAASKSRLASLSVPVSYGTRRISKRAGMVSRPSLARHELSLIAMHKVMGEDFMQLLAWVAEGIPEGTTLYGTH